MKAIILAGGFGTRLRSVINEVPKPMAPIGERPYLSYLIEYLKSQGITEIVLSVHYLREKISNYFGANYLGLPIRYAIEEKPLGTGGGIINSLNIITPPQGGSGMEPVIILNGDTFVKIDYNRLYSLHEKGKSGLTIALRQVDDCSRYGEVIVKNGIITSFNHTGSSKPGLINAGIYVIDRNLFDGKNLPEVFSFEKDFMYPNASSLKPNAFIAEDYFIDIGIPEDYQRACREIPELMAKL